MSPMSLGTEPVPNHSPIAGLEGSDTMVLTKQKTRGRMPERSEAVEGHQTLRAAPPNSSTIPAQIETLAPEQTPMEPKTPERAKRQRT